MEQKDFEAIATGLRRRIEGVGRGMGLPDSDVLLRLWTMRGNLCQVRSVEALAVVIARNLCINACRKRKAVPLKEGLLPPGNRQDQPDMLLEDKDNMAWLADRMGRLPGREYQILHLRQVERKSNSDIAAILGMTPESVATTLSRARRRLLQETMERMKQ